MASLLLTVTVFGIWLGYVVNGGRRQRDAVLSLREVGCDISYSSDNREAKRASGMGPAAVDTAYVPEEPTLILRLAETVGIDLVEKVVGLNLYDNVTDDDLVVLGALRSVESLNLGPKVSDEGLRHVSALRRLRHLSLGSSVVSDEGMKHLRHMSRLEDLHCNALVGDEGLQALSGLANLRDLDLGGSKVTDDGLEHVATFPKLTRLYLAGTAITGEGLSALSRLPKLQDVSLSYTQISDEGLVGLGGITSLKSLSLKKTRVTGPGLRHLANTQLTDLNLTCCDLTPAAVEALAAISTLRSVAITDQSLSNADVNRLRQMRPKLTVSVVEDIGDILGGVGN